MNYEQEFKRSLEAAGIPTTEEKLKTEWQNIADEANLPIANPSKFSAFWVFVTNAVTSPAKWLIQHMYQTVMPNMYVKTASGSFLDLLGWAYDVERKSAVKARGMMTFSRKNTAQAIHIPAGSCVRTIPIKGTIYRMFTDEEAVIPAGVESLEVACTAEKSGSAYNLAAGYYCWSDFDVPGVLEVTNQADYLTVLGADEESDDQLRLRIRYQFASAGDWHTDAKYKSLIASNTGFRPDRIYFKRYDANNYPCRGPASADAFVLFDAGVTPDRVLEDVNYYINTQGNHGHGDDLQVKAMPESTHDVELEVIFRETTAKERRAEILAEIEQVIRCAFRENQDYLDNVTQTWPYARFAFSNLGYELHDLFYEIEALEWGQDDIISDLDVPRLGTLTVAAQD